jgi:hypothetical protein
MFGCRILVHGASVLRLSHTAVDYCGQAGLLRAAVLFDRLTPVSPATLNLTFSSQSTLPNPSSLLHAAVTNNMDAGVHVVSSAARASSSPAGVAISGNVVYKSFDRHTVLVDGTGNTITNNLALGTIKDMSGKSKFDKDMPSTFVIEDPIGNTLTGNVAAGGERVGFMYRGLPCSASQADKARFADNSAHSYLVGAWLRDSPSSLASGCTSLHRFNTWMNVSTGRSSHVAGVFKYAGTIS